MVVPVPSLWWRIYFRPLNVTPVTVFLMYMFPCFSTLPWSSASEGVLFVPLLSVSSQRADRPQAWHLTSERSAPLFLVVDHSPEAFAINQHSTVYHSRVTIKSARTIKTVLKVELEGFRACMRIIFILSNFPLFYFLFRQPVESNFQVHF